MTVDTLHPCSLLFNQALQLVPMLSMRTIIRSCLTALELDIDEAQPCYGCETDADVAALVQALPQLCTLHLMNYAVSVTNAGVHCTPVQSLQALGAVHMLAVCVMAKLTVGPIEQARIGVCNIQTDVGECTPCRPLPAVTS